MHQSEPAVSEALCEMATEAVQGCAAENAAGSMECDHVQDMVPRQAPGDMPADAALAEPKRHGAQACAGWNASRPRLGWTKKLPASMICTFALTLVLQ